MGAAEVPLDAPPAPVSGRLIRKNVSAVGLTYIVAAVAGFATQAVLARELGRATFGTYVAATSLAAIVGVIGKVARMEYVVREGVRDHRRLGALVGDVLWLRVGANLVAAAVVAVAATALGYGTVGIVAAVLIAVMGAADGGTDAFRAGLQATERMEIVAGVSIGVAVLSSVGMVAAVLAGWGLLAAIGISTAVSAAAVPVAWALVRTRIPLRFAVSMSAMRTMVRGSLPFVAVGMLSVAVGYVDAVIIRQVLGREATGEYGAAYRLIVVLGWLPLTYENAVYRSMSELAVRARREFHILVGRSAAGLTVIALPIAMGGLFVGGRILTLVFGEDYAQATDAFRVLLWSLPFAFPATILLSAILAIDEFPRSAGWIMGGALALNVGLNVALVPPFGIVAAAWAMIATEALLVVGATIVLRRWGMRSEWAVTSVLGLVAAAVMGAVVFPLRHLPLVVPVVGGALVYTAMLMILRVPARLGIPMRRTGGRSET